MPDFTKSDPEQPKDTQEGQEDEDDEVEGVDRNLNEGRKVPPDEDGDEVEEWYEEIGLSPDKVTPGDHDQEKAFQGLEIPDVSVAVSTVGGADLTIPKAVEHAEMGLSPCREEVVVPQDSADPSEL